MKGLDGFSYRDGGLHAGSISVASIADQVGTPFYLYSADGIRSAYERVQEAFAPLSAKLHYAVKASPNLHLLRLLRSLGAGMDVVSGGEIERAWLAGAPLSDMVFAGVGKTDAEIRAALDGRFSTVARDAARFGAGAAAERGSVGLFNIESESELVRIEALARELGLRARAAIRVNPDVDAFTHEYTTTGKQENKFGVEVGDVEALFERYGSSDAIELAGLHLHIGSPVRQIEPFVNAIRVALELMDRLAARGHRVTHLDLGGGWPIEYFSGEAPPISAYGEAITPLLADRVADGLSVVVEPGRSIVGNAGILVTRVHHVKEGRSRRFVICDAGMHTLIRPALYQAFHFVWPVEVVPSQQPELRMERPELPDLVSSDVVGPICESSDFLARERWIPRVARGDLLSVFSAGAYGISIASNYNDHGRPAEVLVDGSEVRVINERQALPDVLETERQSRRLDLG